MNNIDIQTCDRVIEVVNKMTNNTLIKFAKDNNIKQSDNGIRTTFVKRNLIVSHIMKCNCRFFADEEILHTIEKLDSDDIDYYTKKDKSGRWNPLVQDMDLMELWEENIKTPQEKYKNYVLNNSDFFDV